MTIPNEKLTPVVHSAHNRCFGCGEANPVGLHLKFFLAEDGRVVSDIIVPDVFEGPFGTVHGGIVATLLDEGMSKAVRSHGVQNAMTAKMEVSYRRPVPSSTPDVSHPVRLEGRVVRIDGRKHWVEAKIRNAAGEVLAESTGLFLAPKPERISSAGSAIAERPASLGS